MKQGKRSILFVAILLLALSGVYIYFSGFYLLFFSDLYGREFNDERVRIGQPVIESYFSLKSPKRKNTHVWFTPDSLRKNKLHTSKVISTVMGKVDFETDYYQVKLDTTWIRSVNFDTLTYEIVNGDSLRKEYPRQTFKRGFSFRDKSIEYEIEILIDEKRILKKKLSRSQGDSIISASRDNEFL